MKKLVTYPRGFVGFVREGFNTDSVVTTPESLNINKVLSAARFNQQIQNTVSAKTYNSSVTELWAKYRENNKNFSNMKFREEVLVAALRCFGTKSFYEWCKVQEESKTFTNLHKSFLNDTFNYLTSGNRTVSILTWSTVLSLREINDNDRKQQYHLAEFLATNKGDHYYPQPIGYVSSADDIQNIIIRWVAKPGGFEDLLNSIYILFGKD